MLGKKFEPCSYSTIHGSHTHVHTHTHTHTHTHVRTCTPVNFILSQWRYGLQMGCRQHVHTYTTHGRMMMITYTCIQHASIKTRKQCRAVRVCITQLRRMWPLHAPIFSWAKCTGLFSTHNHHCTRVPTAVVPTASVLVHGAEAELRLCFPVICCFAHPCPTHSHEFDITKNIFVSYCRTAQYAMPWHLNHRGDAPLLACAGSMEAPFNNRTVAAKRVSHMAWHYIAPRPCR